MSPDSEQKWAVVDTDYGVHVLPLDESDSHERTTVCPCGPRVEVNERLLVIHMAFDGRHLVEQAHLILNPDAQP